MKVNNVGQLKSLSHSPSFYGVKTDVGLSIVGAIGIEELAVKYIFKSESLLGISKNLPAHPNPLQIAGLFLLSIVLLSIFITGINQLIKRFRNS